MFSILKDVIAVPDIATLSTHPMHGISRYTYALKCVCLAVDKFIEEQDVLAVSPLVAFCRGAFVSDVVIKQPSMATLTTRIADLLLLASGFSGLDRSSALIVANDD